MRVLACVCVWKKQDRSAKNGYEQHKKYEIKNNNLIFSLKKIAVCQGQEEAGQATQGH
jgi:hypothetical protein